LILIDAAFAEFAERQCHDGPLLRRNISSLKLRIQAHESREMLRAVVPAVMSYVSCEQAGEALRVVLEGRQLTVSRITQLSLQVVKLSAWIAGFTLHPGLRTYSSSCFHFQARLPAPSLRGQLSSSASSTPFLSPQHLCCQSVHSHHSSPPRQPQPD